MDRSVCILHPDRRASARCATCHKPICEECVLADAGSSFCSELCRDNYRKFHATYRPLKEGGFWAALKSYAISLFWLALLALAAFYACAKILKIPFFMRLWER